MRWIWAVFGLGWLGLLTWTACSTIAPSPTAMPPAARPTSLADAASGPVLSSVEGVVYDANGPVVGATVRVRATDNKTTTAADGSFTLGGLTASVPVSVTAWAEGYFVGWTSAVPGTEAVTITLKPYYTTDNPDYTWFSLEGRVPRAHSVAHTVCPPIP